MTLLQEVFSRSIYAPDVLSIAQPEALKQLKAEDYRQQKQLLMIS